MGRKRKILLVAVILAAVLIAAWAVLRQAASGLGPRAEAALTSALGREVRVEGVGGVGVFPSPWISLRQIRAEGLFSAKEARVGLELFPALRGDLKLKNLDLLRPDVNIVRAADGSLNVGGGKKKGGGALPSVRRLSVSEGRLTYRDLASGVEVELRGVELSVRGLSFSEGTGGLPGRASFKGSLKCESARVGKFEASQVVFSVEARDGVYDLDPLVMNAFGGRGNGSVKADMTGKGRTLEVHYEVSGLSIGEFLSAFSEKGIMSGKVDLQVVLSMKAGVPGGVIRTINGHVALRGEDLVLEGIDLDKVLREYERSQEVSLVDVGAYFLAGPLGSTLTKGYRFASLYVAAGAGKGTVKKLISRWRVQDGTARAEDVAMRTAHYRVAMKGGLDFAGESFKDVTLAVVDEKGCAAVSQTIKGPFEKPEVEKPTIIESLAGPVLGLFKKTGKLLGAKCEVFYEGSVEPPEGK